MDKVQEFRHHASQCRALASRALSAEIRSRYLQLARVWERLADERLTFLVPRSRPGGLAAE